MDGGQGAARRRRAEGLDAAGSNSLNDDQDFACLSVAIRSFADEGDRSATRTSLYLDQSLRLGHFGGCHEDGNRTPSRDLRAQPKCFI
jgi:hypothetical protein